MRFKVRETFLYAEMAGGEEQIGRKMTTASGLKGIVVAGTTLTVTVEFSLTPWQAIRCWSRRWLRDRDFHRSPGGKFALSFARDRDS